MPIVEFLTAPLPLLSDFGVNLTAIDLIGAVADVDLGFIDAVSDIIALVESIPTGDESIEITFFDKITIFDYTDADAQPDLSDPNVDLSGSERTENDPESQLEESEGDTANFTKTLTKSEGFSFPIVTSRTG